MGYSVTAKRSVESRHRKHFRILFIEVGEWWKRILLPIFGSPGPKPSGARRAPAGRGTSRTS